MTKNDDDNDWDYVTRDDVNIAILREIAKIRFRERLPLIIAGVARNLVAAGADFSKVDYSKLGPVADIDAIYEDLF